MARSLPLLCAALLGLLLALPSWLTSQPDLHVRTQPWFPFGGRILTGSPLVQEFHCESNGLERIELAVSHLSGEPEGALILELSSLESPAEILRSSRAEARSLLEPSGFLRFDFTPLPDSADRWYSARFRVEAASGSTSLSPALRLRRRLGDGQAETSPGAVPLERDFMPRYQDLSAIAIELASVSPDAAPLALEVYDPESPEVVLARARWSRPVPLRRAWHVFELDSVVTDSRYRDLRLRLLPSSGVRLKGNAEGPAFLALCGAVGQPTRLGALEIQGERRTDQDLVLRTWSSGTSGDRFILVGQRLGPRGPLALLLLLAACYTAARALRTQPASPSQRMAKRA